MVQLMLRMRARPGSCDEMVIAAQSLLRPLFLAGQCVRHELYRGALAPDDICYLEEWSSAQALHDEICSVRFTKLLALMEHAAEAPRLEIHYVGESRGLDLVAELRGRPATEDGDGAKAAAPIARRRRRSSRKKRSARATRC